MASPAGQVRIATVTAIVFAIAMSAASIYSQTVGTNEYRAIPNAFKLPDGRTWGSTSSVFIDRKGHIWTFDRCGDENCLKSNLAPILEYDASGNLVKALGAGIFALPHGLFVDKHGNVWVADAGMGTGPGGRKAREEAGAEGLKLQKGEQVIELSPDGKVLMRLGKAGVAGDGADSFHYPTDVVVAPNGDIFVSDGHSEISWGPGESNARIVKFSPDGKFIKAWGMLGLGPGEFSSPHSMAMDSSGRLFVADRNNMRIQIFDQDGKFLGEWRQFGRPSGIFIDARDDIYVCGDQDRPTLVGVSKLQPGIRIGNTKDGKVRVYIPAVVGPNGKPDTYEGCAGDGKGHVYGGGSHPWTGITEWVKVE